METLKNGDFLPTLSRVLFVLIALGFLTYVGQGIIVPVAFSALLAILLIPVCNFFIRRLHLNRVLSALLAVLIACLFIAGVIYFLSAQVSGFVQDMPAIRKQLNEHISTLQKWLDSRMHISRSEQTQYIESATSQLKGSGGMIGETFMSITGSLFTLFLLPIYTFLILYYRTHIRTFLINVFRTESQAKVQDVIGDSRVIVQSYMVGLLIEMFIVAIINCGGLLILGVKYAIFLGVLAAILNLIPYVGMILASIICMLITLTSSNEISDVIYVLVILVAVQFIDNNIIMPKVVGSKVKINALVTIMGVLIGGTLAGIAGMFLSIPVIAILKAIFDRVDHLKPWGALLGEEVSQAENSKKPRGRKAAPKASSV